MRSVSVMAAASLLVCGWVFTGVAQGQKPAPNITTLAGDVQADWYKPTASFWARSVPRPLLPRSI